MDVSPKKSQLKKILLPFVLIFLLCIVPCIVTVVIVKLSLGQDIPGLGVDTEETSVEEDTEESTESGEEEAVVDESDSSSVQKYAVVIGGASGDDTHYGWFRDSSRQAYDLLIDEGYLPENIYYLFESSQEEYVDYEATISNFELVVQGLSQKTEDNDFVVFIFIGHGTSDGVSSYFEFNDFLLKDSDIAEYLSGITRDTLVVVMSQCNSGGFVNDLSADDTVIVTSTRLDESNRAAFVEPFLTALSGEGDSNDDSKVSILEAFSYASENVQQQYTNNNWGNLVEHSQLDDNGDGYGSEYPISGGDGDLAKVTFL